MAKEEPLVEQKSDEKSSSAVRMGIIVGIAVLAPAVLALLLFNFVFRPLLAGEQTPTRPTQVSNSAFPPNAVAYEFPESQATVVAQDFDSAAPLLIYQVALICDSPATYQLIEQRNTWFNAMVAKLHRNRTRSELNDPYIQEMLLRQVRDDANELLQKFAPKGKNTVIEAMYIKFAIFDL